MTYDNFELLCNNIKRNIDIIHYKLECIKASYSLTNCGDHYEVTEQHLHSMARTLSPETFETIPSLLRSLSRAKPKYNERYLKYERLAKLAADEMYVLDQTLTVLTLRLRKVKESRDFHLAGQFLKQVDTLYIEVNGTFPTTASF